MVGTLEAEEYFANPEDELFDPVAEERPFWDSARYLFVVASIERNPQVGQYGANNIWNFEVFYDEQREPVRLEQDGTTPCQLRQYISKSMTPGSTGRPIIEAILGKRLADDDVVRKSDLLGKPFWGILVNKPPKDDPRGKKRPKIESPEKLQAARPRQAPRFQAPAPARRVVPVLEEVEDLPF